MALGPEWAHFPFAVLERPRVEELKAFTCVRRCWVHWLQYTQWWP
jgi:hypothetical protein